MTRVSVADRQVTAAWRNGKSDPARSVNRVPEQGAESGSGDAAGPAAAPSPALPSLLCGLGVAALAALAIRLLPAVITPDAAARIAPGRHGDLVCWLAAAIAVPAAVFAGRPFFIASVRAAAAGSLSREASVSAAILLALGLSAAEAPNSAVPPSYDTGLMLLAAALAVRTLEHALLRLAPARSLAIRTEETVTKFISGAELADVPAAAVRPGDMILVRPGERIAVDGTVTDGRSEVDQSRVTGETLPVSVARDSPVYAGTLNVSGALRVRVARIEEFAADASDRVRAAGRAMRLLPLVTFAAAFGAFAARAASGADGHDAAAAAIAALVLTCPAVPGLAICAVRTWAARALARAGLLLTSGCSIERLAQVDAILFDKTGTLTVPEPEVVNTADIPPERLALAGRLALSSRHPLASAVVRAAGATAPLLAVEEPGQGVRCVFQGVPLWLGRPSFCNAERRASAILQTDPEASVIAFACGTERYVLAVRQRLRSDAIEAIARLKQDGFSIEILSGDRAPAVCHAAEMLGIECWHAGMTPPDKTGRIRALQAQGHTVLMVGDGLNDAPSLAAADAALSVGTATPCAHAAADATVAGDGLAPVSAAVAIARHARRLQRQNLWLVAACTAVALPLAISGIMGPLAAALTMVAVAAAVTLNALRAAVSAAASSAQ
jgi:Cu2+-exporting ATPase